MRKTIPPMPIIRCTGDTVMTYNPMSNGWECALPRSTAHYLADKDRWIMCPQDWVLTQDRTTGAYQWVAPPRSRAIR